MIEPGYAHEKYGPGEDLGEGPASYSKPHRVLRFGDGLIRRVPEIELRQMWWAHADLDGVKFVSPGDTPEQAEAHLIAEMEKHLGIVGAVDA